MKNNTLRTGYIHEQAKENTTFSLPVTKCLLSPVLVYVLEVEMCLIWPLGRQLSFKYYLIVGMRATTRYKPVLTEDKGRFPDSSFSASSSTKGHSPSDARISSGSSWCTPVADGKHYLQVDLGRVYYIRYIATYGDSNSLKWVAKYQVNYTIDMLNWQTSTRVRKQYTTINSNIISSN